MDCNGGEGGIRTHGTVSRTLAFEASTFNRSVTSPRVRNSIVAERGEVGQSFARSHLLARAGSIKRVRGVNRIAVLEYAWRK